MVEHIITKITITKNLDQRNNGTYCKTFDVIINKMWAKHVWEEFYNQHTRYVRTIAKANPSITYYEFDLEDPNINIKMSQAFPNIPTECWRHKNTNNNNNNNKQI